MTLKSFLASGLFLSAIAIPSSSFASEGKYFTGSIGASRIGDIDIDGLEITNANTTGLRIGTRFSF